jgi:GNAT superfamily N-acetyltransferase
MSAPPPSSRIRPCDESDFASILDTINDGARAYIGHLPPDRLRDPYMSADELRHEINDGVQFWAHEETGPITAVMGIQPVRDVTLIRHAYVRSDQQNKGIGGQMLSHLHSIASGPILIGTWADAIWAIRFYQRHGFVQVSHAEKERLLKTYWNVPDRQIETSVVLAEAAWLEQASRVTPST